MHPRPCSTPALARAPAGSQCEHALPPALLTWDPSHTLCMATRTRETWASPTPPCSSHLFAWVVSLCSLLLPSCCQLPGLIPVPGVASGLDFGETRQAWGPCWGRVEAAIWGCSALPQKLGSLLLLSQCGHEHIVRKGLPHTVPATHASQLHPSPSALHPASI